MNKYEKMFENGEYLEIINELELNKEPENIWLVVDSYVQINQIDNAIRTIENNRDILLKDDPKKTMFLNIDLLILNNDFVRALKTLSIFEELPYISIEIEELLPELKDYIYKSMNKKSSSITNADIIKSLNNYDNQEMLLRSLYEIEKRDYKPFFNELRNILVSENINDNIKTLILILLSEKKCNEKVKIIKKNFEGDVIPSQIKPIITTKEIEILINNLIDEKDITIIKCVQDMLTSYFLSIYPKSLSKNDEEKYVYAHYLLALELFDKDKTNAFNLIKKHNFDIEEIEEIKALLK